MFKNIIAIAATAIAVIGVGAGVASAAPTPTPVTYVASIGSASFSSVSNGTGSSAVVNAGDTISLTVGTPVASAYAQADLALPANSVVPTTEPLFTTNNFSTGSPRWVIQLGNGNALTDNQSSSTVQASDVAGGVDWSVKIGTGGWSNTLETYSDAVKTAGGFGQVVSNAFIVADGDQVAGTTDVISHVSWDGTPMTVAALTTGRPHLTNGHVITVNNNDAQFGWTYSDLGWPAGTKYVLARTFGRNMTDATGKPHVGFTSADFGSWSGLAAGSTYDIELIPADANRNPLPNAQVGWINLVTTR